MNNAGTLSIGLVGGGAAAQRLVRAIKSSDRITLRALLCAADELTDVDLPARASNLDELLSADAVGVYIATPVHTHIPLAMAAIAARKHVLIEKPLGVSVRDLQPLVARERGARLVIGTAFKKRFSLGTTLIERLSWIKESKVRAYYRWHVPPPPQGNWRHLPQMSGGGVVMDLGSHVIDLFEFLFGPIVAVRARTSALLDTRLVESAAALDLRFQSGSQALLDLSWHGAEASFDFKIEAGVHSFHQRTATPDEDECVIVDRSERRCVRVDRRAEYLELLSAFGRAIQGCASLLPSLEDAARNLHIIDAIYQAARSNRIVETSPSELCR